MKTEFLNKRLERLEQLNLLRELDFEEGRELAEIKRIKQLIIDSVSISNRVKMNYLESKYEVKWLKNDTYQVEQDGKCIYQDTETGCNEYLKGLLGY